MGRGVVEYRRQQEERQRKKDQEPKVWTEYQEKLPYREERLRLQREQHRQQQQQAEEQQPKHFIGVQKSGK